MSGRPILVVATLIFGTLGMLFVPSVVSQGDPQYCAQNPADPRCRPDYCQQNPNDPWCRDPAAFCREHPQDPICNKGPVEKKDICAWTQNGAPANPLTRGAHPGPQVLSLDCPNHILASWTCGFKEPTEPGVAANILPTDPACVYVGHAATGAPCATSDVWQVVLPNLNTYTTFLTAKMWKDENCDGAPDDWNTGYVTPDGTVACELPREYGPKTGFPSYPYQPRPDGVVNECDLQVYDIQWRQFN